MDTKELGRQVLTKRKEKELSQEDLGNLAGISRNYVSLIERGEAHNISMKVINQLAVALGASPAELTGESSWVMIPSSLRDYGIQNNMPYEVIDTLAHIPKRGKEPTSIEGWEDLYNAIAPFLGGENKE
ncbi:MAG TPA: helix-turn-helix transcriptional regulator [Bellilinea sp.]|nr:helix-turn-helix transcriptional regulator [Bellilinea sp.]